DTKTPNRPDLAAEWTGQSLTGHDSVFQWMHNDTHIDWWGQYRDVSDGFRAEAGFVPQVGYRETAVSTGWTFRPTNFLTRLRLFFNVDRQVDRDGALLYGGVQPGLGMDTRMSGFMQFRFSSDEVRTPGGVTIPRHQLYTTCTSALPACSRRSQPTARWGRTSTSTTRGPVAGPP